MSDSVDWSTFKSPAPDYSNGTSISNSTNTWTAPKCGVVIAVLVATGDVVKFSATDGQSTVSERMFYPYKWV